MAVNDPAHPLGTQAARRKFNRKMRAAGVPEKVCGQCLSVKDHSEFPRNRNQPDGRDSTCSGCANKRQAAYVAADRVRYMEMRRVRRLKARKRAL